MYGIIIVKARVKNFFDKKRIRLSVVDRGIGISEDH